ncbi:8744_t:CDS:2 [Funneliformis geosporum]|uniref:644_t:CDS:1 n=1 Tax=Funneliformis geosporum TaxID=1117311 RepID=A0A9W4SQF5_9GLOM|nr:8744_t:CDS:2 [Funneliformis geosporum]CAI2177887.1 644_t:CDS:2 [Funneliformis geosporum]
MPMFMSEPRVTGKHSKFKCEQKARDVDYFFKSQPASNWSFELYINEYLADPNLNVTFDQLLRIFVDSLDQMNQLHVVPLTIRANCTSYIRWLQLSTGKALVSTCREVFDAKIDLEKKFRLNSVFKKSVGITAQTRGFKALLQPVPSEIKPSPSVFLSEAESSPSVFPSEAESSPSVFPSEAESSPSVFPSEAELSSPVFLSETEPSPSLSLSNALQPSNAPDALPPKTPPQPHRELAHLWKIPNKRPIENEEPRHYTQNNLVICAFALTTKELEAEIGIELTKELSSMRDRNPAIWNPALEGYIDTTLKESGDKFKDVVRNKDIIDIDEPFRLYCEKILSDFYNLVDVSPTMNRKIGKRKHIVYQVSALFKFYERTFLSLDIDWIESHSRSAKIFKSESNSGIVLVDAKATRISDGLDIWHLEVAGPPCNAIDKHVLGDSKKTFQTDILNLISILREHLDCDMDLATKIKVFSTQSINNRLTLYSLNLLPNGRFLSCELASAVLPFSLIGRGQYKSVLRTMSIFHDEITKQEMLFEEINKTVTRSKKLTVRQALKIPKAMVD